MTSERYKLDFTPSPYQEKIFDFVLHGSGNAMIKASAGSGKTKVLVTSMKLLPRRRKCLFIAFNKSIVNELISKLEGYDNCTIKTIHSLGYSMILRNFEGDVEVNEYKYRLYLKNNVTDLITLPNGVEFTERQINEYLENILKLVDYSRFNLAQSEDEIRKIANKYSIPLMYEEPNVVVKLLEWGCANTNVVDYTDMVWLPIELGLQPKGYQFDWVFFDEAQDASIMAIALFRKCIKRGTRVICAGDPDQSINIFAGASEDAFEELSSGKNTSVFTLPLTYRCSKKITEYANHIVDDIIPLDDAPEGQIIYDATIPMLRDGDMVLARSKTPLINLYVRLLRRNTNCYIKGQNIGANLIKLIENVNIDNLAVHLNGDGVFTRLYDMLFEERKRLMQQTGLDLRDATMTNTIMELYDSISALQILAEMCKNKEELIKHISDVFKEDSDGICLSTIHKAKGLESDRVFILCNSSLPSKMGKADWEKRQEVNLQYVAYTRAKTLLGFISEDIIKPSASLLDAESILNDLNFIEHRVCDILGKTATDDVDPVEYSRYKLKNATVITDEHPQINSVAFDEEDDEMDLDEIMGMIN